MASSEIEIGFYVLLSFTCVLFARISYWSGNVMNAIVLLTSWLLLIVDDLRASDT